MCLNFVIKGGFDFKIEIQILLPYFNGLELKDALIYILCNLIWKVRSKNIHQLLMKLIVFLHQRLNTIFNGKRNQLYLITTNYVGQMKL